MSAGTATRRRRGSPRRAAGRAVRRLSPRHAAGRAVRRLSPRFRRRLVVLGLVCLTLAAGYQFWLRDSSLVAVDRVEVTGLTTSDAARVREALTSAGRTMTTLHVDRDALERAVAGYPVVRELEISADFPDGLRVHVVEYEPAAIAVGDSGSVPVAGDGTILRGLRVDGRLPTVDVDGALGTKVLLDRTARAGASVAGAAPAALRSRIVDVQRRSDEGYVAQLRDGPELIFGAATRLRAKWAAAARVLADLEARGASYLDLRIPSRPAVGGLAGTTLAPVAPAAATPGVSSGGSTETGSVTPESAQTSVPNTLPEEAAAPPATPPAGTADPTVTEAPAPPADPLTAGAGGGATAAP